jgi:hypothetical protein
MIAQCVQIALDTFGAIGITEMMDMYIDDFKMIVEGLRKKDA